MIPFKVLPIGEEEKKAVAAVLDSKQLSMGRKVIELEVLFGEYVGVDYAVAVDSCTSALFLSMMYRKSKTETREILCPSITVPLVANTITHAGLTPVFTDDTDWVGRSYMLHPFNIIDSAHEVNRGIISPDKRFTACYSFYPTKPISSCEGGIVATNDKEMADWVKQARWYGRSEGDSHIKNSWEYDIDFPGWKMNMTDIQAAIAVEQLKKLDRLSAERQRVVSLYNKLLGKTNTSLYLYRLNVDRRNEFITYMKTNGVECGIHFKPLHLMTAFKDYEVRGDRKKIETEGETTVSLPLYDSLSDRVVERIAELVLNWSAQR